MAGRRVTRVLVVEDAEIVASGMRATVEQDPENAVIAIVPSVASAFEVVRTKPVDILLADIRLADGTAFDLLKMLATLSHRPPTLIFSSFDLAQYVDAAVRLGACGYLLKTAPASELLSAIHIVARGGRAFDPDLVSRATAAAQLALSPRERQVVSGIMAGRTNDEIGADLGISRKTVEASISRLFERFEVGSRAELTRRAEREQWLESPWSTKTPDPLA